MSTEDNIRRIIESIRDENDGLHLDLIIPGYSANKVIGYQGIRQDLFACKDYVNSLISTEHSPTIGSSLLYSFIALYGRCFTDASSSSSPKLERTDFSSDQDELLDLHDEIMSMRHNFVAHRGSTDHETGFAYIKLNTEDLSVQVQVKQVKRAFPEASKLNSYIVLLNHLIAVAEARFEKAGIRAWKHIREEYTGEMFAQLKIAGPTKKS
jgi:hypothetical protein